MTNMRNHLHHEPVIRLDEQVLLVKVSFYLSRLSEMGEPELAQDKVLYAIYDRALQKHKKQLAACAFGRRYPQHAHV